MNTRTARVWLAAAAVLCSDAGLVAAQPASGDLKALRERCAPHLGRWRSASGAARQRVYAEMPVECRALAEEAQKVRVEAPPPAPAGPVDNALRSRLNTFVSGGLRLWSEGDQSLTMVGVELGTHASKYVAFTVDVNTGSDDGERGYAVRSGLRAYFLPGAFSPYVGGRAGILVGGGDPILVWQAGAGAELALEPSGFFFDLGLSRIGVLSGLGNDVRGSVNEVSLSVGKRF